MSGRKLMKIAVMAVVAALFVQPLAFGAQPAGSGSDSNGGSILPEEFGTSLKNLNYNRKAGIFSGTVESDFGNDADDSVADNNACTKGRKVTVRNDKTNAVVGSDKTNKDGDFSIDGPKRKKAANYSAKVSEEEFLYRVYYGLDVFGLCLGDHKGF